MRKDYLLKLSSGDTLDISAYGSPENSKRAVICVHGFKGFKDWGFWKYFSESLVDEKFFVITFNFSHNGVGIGSVDFDEPEKFALNTFSREVKELLELIDAVSDGFFENTEIKNISLVGHSRGGADAILATSKSDKINALVTWSSIAKLNRYSERQIAEWKSKGVFEVINTRTKQVMRMNVSFIEDIETNEGDYLNVQKALSRLSVPYLIVHGEKDLAVPLAEGKQLYEWSNKETTEFKTVEAAGHTFDVVHPFDAVRVNSK